MMLAETKVNELRPGDEVIFGGGRATFVATEPHPKYPSLRLVIWRLDDGSWSLDALDPWQVVGTIDLDMRTPDVRWARVERAFDS